MTEKFWARLGATLALVITISFLFSSLIVTKTVAKRGKQQDSAQRPETVFTNSANITINDAANATPYPSTIAVSGLTGNIPATAGSVKVTLNSFSHTFPDDVGIVLVGPTGAALCLQDGAGDDPDMVNVTYTFSDTGATQLPNLDAWPTGVYKPTAYYTGDPFPAPGPGTTYGNPGPGGAGTATFSSTFAGTAPNGNWNLFVIDFAAGDVGAISGGWTLEINTGSVAASTAPFDFDNDGKSDKTVFRSTDTNWYVLGSTAGFSATQWGAAGDTLVPADYDGDHKADIAVYRPSQGTWYIVGSTAGMSASNFGLSTDKPVPADYDGDGKADVAVFRPSTATWYVLGSTAGFSGTPFGASTDKLVPGKWDSDAKADFAVYRASEGNWYVLGTTAGASTTNFGISTDLPVPADYDGDGKLDKAVFRNGTWYVLNSSNGAFSGTSFGAAADSPIPNAYVR